MGFLGRILKTPAADQPEEQDEFNAEEKGLLMVPSLPGTQAEPEATEGDAAEGQLFTAEDGPMSPPEAGPKPDGTASEPAAGEGGPLDLATAPSAAGDGSEAEQGPSDDTLDLFRDGVVKVGAVSSAVMEGLEDVSAAELLAEARAIRDSLVGGAAGSTEEAGRRAA